ncbi:unnamed protein product, partial [Mesorhabditis spiculigera]
MRVLFLISVVISVQAETTPAWEFVTQECDVGTKDCKSPPDTEPPVAGRLWFSVRDEKKDTIFYYTCGLAETFCMSMNDETLTDDKIGCYDEDPNGRTGCQCAQPKTDDIWELKTPVHSELLSQWRSAQKPGESKCGIVIVRPDDVPPTSSARRLPLFANVIVVVVALIYPTSSLI